METTGDGRTDGARLSNPFAAALARDRTLVGLWHVINDRAATEALADVPFDFVIVDMQHWMATLDDIAQVVSILRHSSVSVVVRVPGNTPAVIGQVLDIGVDAVIVPMVNSAVDAMAAVRAATYPPAGIRSWGPRRLHRFDSPQDYALRADANAVVIVQIETAESVAAIEDIAAVAGIGAIAVGPADLAISMGFSQDRSHAAVAEAARQVRAVCQDAGVPFGFFAGSRADAVQWLAEGLAITACESDLGFAIQGARELAVELDTARAAVPGI